MESEGPAEVEAAAVVVCFWSAIRSSWVRCHRSRLTAVAADKETPIEPQTETTAMMVSLTQPRWLREGKAVEIGEATAVTAARFQTALPMASALKKTVRAAEVAVGLRAAFRSMPTL